MSGADLEGARVAIVLLDQATKTSWMAEHAQRLAFIYSRSELRAAWREVPTSMRTSTSLARRKSLAAQVARCDAAVLVHQGAAAPWSQSRRHAAARRVLVVGTPTWWSGAGVEVDGPCPLRAVAVAHRRRSGADPRCIWCALVIGQAEPVHRAALAEQLWSEVARHYGLTREQVAEAAHALGDLIDVRRGLEPVEPAAMAPAAAVPARQVVVGGSCRHICTGADPVCWHCGAVVGQVQPVNRRALAGEVWRKVAHRHGLSQDQVADAIDDLADSINARRGLSVVSVDVVGRQERSQH